ncbi:serine O-acetyltransferase EpsC [Methylocystis echinoides]|uniref:serine O-acetyltransferase n=1 Tax=Methylocystis echinoides TaxID=29468 RepID=A0A9W6GXA6_9HYPH|nr:serine O-acetyltransferase EpsC [Methylocystis echinoides]GLI94811.1 serine O-acetyltransferase [Methylocystis echinoides]
MAETVETQTRAPEPKRFHTVVTDLAALRKAAQARRYGNGVFPPELPSRAVIAKLLIDLAAILYPRHFGPPEEQLQAPDQHLARQLDRVFLTLREQVRRELKLFSSDMTDEAVALRATEIAEDFVHGLPKVRALLDTDVTAAYLGDPAAKSIDEVIFCYPGVVALIRHRLAHRLYRLGAPMSARIIAEIAHSETGIDIHPGATIDEGFFIDHGTGVVIGETTIIGKGVRLYQAVTLGAKRFNVEENGGLEKGKPRHPIIEDDVVIYAGATVLGRITIGRGSSIGGNVWLTHSVPPGSNITQAKAHVEFFDHGAGI